MSATLSVAASAGQRAASFSLRRLRAGAAVRIAFGVVWAIDAVFKWLPGFVHGQTLSDELGAASVVRTPVIHQWIGMWAYIAASLVLFVAAAGATWSVDGWLRPRLGPLAWLASPTAAELAGQPAG